MSEVAAICRRARVAARQLLPKSRAAKDTALRAIATGLRNASRALVTANAGDVEEARARGTSEALVDRLALTQARVEQMAEAVEQIADLEDPVGHVLQESVRPNGLRVRRVTVPIGVVAIVYESRPNVTVDASALCLKAGNAVVLRGGSDAARSNAAILKVIQEALAASGLPADAVLGLPPGDRGMIRELLQQTDTVDLAIPRGGEALIRFVQENARVPVIAHAKGVCHMFVDAGADLEMATRLALNAKLQRPGTCNTIECLLVDAHDAERLLPPLARALMEGGCEIRGDERTVTLVPGAKAATADDWGHEYLDRILAVRVVDGIDGALDHIARYGSGHTEAIVTRNDAHAERFRHEVDTACVAVNASTRLHDGGALGLGTEMGTATTKLHWRGTMGLQGLTTFQWILDGDGQVRE
ncbi:MAG TPA: glutamate-5-semialdehyde dehydrogenase [Polyangiaceae bacterium]|nr:glutamate-5-semialdehyde dehydrogenase [Polyangiaceae bacterium]